MHSMGVKLVANAPRARSIWSRRSRPSALPPSAAQGRSRPKPELPASTCGWRRGQAVSPRPRPPARQRPPHRRPKRRQSSVMPDRHRPRGRSREDADRGRVRKTRASRRRQLRLPQSPAGSKPEAAARPRARLAPRQSRSQPRFAVRLPQTPHASRPKRARLAGAHRPPHARAAPCAGHMPRHASRCARCGCVRPQDSVPRSSCAAS